MAGMMKTLGSAMRNIGKTGANGDYLGAAVKGAAIGAGIGGVQSFASGGSFLEGAKSGVFSGATIGAGARAFKVGAMGKNWSNNRGWKGFQKAGSNYKGMAGAYGDKAAGQAAGKAYWQNQVAGRNLGARKNNMIDAVGGQDAITKYRKNQALFANPKIKGIRRDGAGKRINEFKENVKRASQVANRETLR